MTRLDILITEYRGWRYDLIPHAWSRMKHDYYWGAAYTILGWELSAQFLQKHRRKFKLALCGGLLLLPAILTLTFFLAIDYGMRTVYADGFKQGFSDSLPVRCAQWWAGQKFDKTRWRLREQMMKKEGKK